MRTCNFPGCTTSIENSKAGTRWCPACRVKMHNNKAARREGAKVRQALFPHAHRVAHPKMHERRTEPREAQVKCKRCYGMPWARVNDRLNECSGGMGVPSVPVVGVDGRCLGCGLPYEPEPKPELCGSVRSSAGLCSEHGSLYGNESVYRGTGSAKK